VLLLVVVQLLTWVLQAPAAPLLLLLLGCPVLP
jgi:hypothetical protein